MKILVTGIGIISAIGNNAEETLLSITESKSGISQIKHLNTSHQNLLVGEVKLTAKEMKHSLNIPDNTPSIRTSLIGMMATKEAIQSAGLNTKNMSDNLCVLLNGTTVGGMDKTEEHYLDFISNNSKNEYISMQHCGTCTEMIADYHGCFRRVYTISTACSSAANAILFGANLLKHKQADIVIAGGSECITKFHLNGFNSLMIIDELPCRPFDAKRQGLNLGEGAAFVVLETEEHFLKRKSSTQPYAELKGGANVCEAYHQTASSPDGKGAFKAMHEALAAANLLPSDISYINAHGTGTPNNDLSEGKAIEQLWGDNIPPVSSTKSFTGHTTSAAGAVEAVISILSLQNNFIPPNLNFENPMEELNFSPVVKIRQNIMLKHILSNSFGFGGNDTSLIFSKI